MKRETIDPRWLEEAKKCAEIAQSGGTLLYPSETLWGLGCAADNTEALQKIANIKERPAEKSFITLVSSWRMLQSVVAEIPPVAEEIIDVSDEAITIIYQKANKPYEHLCAPNGSIAVRLVENAFVSLFLERLRKPIISTSANKSGIKAPRHYEEIADEILSEVDYVADHSINYKLIGNPSKVISVQMDGTIKVLR